MRVIVVVGMPAAGKNIARIWSESNGIPYFATGDLVRQEVSKRGLEPNPENMAVVSTELRENDGLGVTRHALKKAMDSGSTMVFLEGMRSWPEIELIREKTDALVVAFLAPRNFRLDRIKARRRADDSAEAFAERDNREIDYGTTIPIALADEYVLNTGTIDDALKAMDAVIRKYA